MTPYIANGRETCLQRQSPRRVETNEYTSGREKEKSLSKWKCVSKPIYSSD